MPKTIVLEPHLTTQQLHKRYRNCRDHNEKLRWKALYLIASGTRAAQAARSVGRSSAWITNLAARYNDGGFDSVPDKDKFAKSRRAATVNEELALELDAALHAPAPDGGLWTANKVADWIQTKTGRRLHETSAWRIMRSLGVRPCRHRARNIQRRRARKRKTNGKKTHPRSRDDKE